MAMTDEEEAKLKQELAAKEAQLKELLAKQQVDEKAVKEAEAKRAKEKPGKVELDPDVVKEIATMKAEIAELKGLLGKSTAKGKPSDLLNFFGD